MDTQTLRERLTQLHTELTHTTVADPAVHAQLQTLITDAQAILERSEPAPQSAQPLSRRFREAVSLFEAEHPQLVWTMTQVSDTLSRMGF